MAECIRACIIAISKTEKPPNRGSLPTLHVGDPIINPKMKNYMQRFQWNLVDLRQLLP